MVHVTHRDAHSRSATVIRMSNGSSPVEAAEQAVHMHNILDSCLQTRLLLLFHSSQLQELDFACASCTRALSEVVADRDHRGDTVAPLLHCSELGEDKPAL